jgi:colanic acid biosynthesis glycosyl transferase WcaI
MADVTRPAKSSNLAGKRVLIIGTNYWPEETGTGPYTTGMAANLVEAGARVSVVTGFPHYPAWRIADAYRGRFLARESKDGVSILRVRHYVPKRQDAIRRGLYETTFLLHSLLHPVSAADVVIGVVPGLSAGVLATLEARRLGVPAGLVFQDLVGQAATQSGIPGGRLVAGTATRAEGWVARKACAVAIVSEAFRPYLVGIGVPASRILNVPNWTRGGAPRRDRERTRRWLGWQPQEQIVLHAGNMGLKQGLETVVLAASLAASRDEAVRFVLMGDGSQREGLRAQGRGIRTLSFLPPVDEDWFMDVLAAADVLLVNQRPSVEDMSLPSKLTSYFRAGRPIVAAVDPQGAAAQEVVRSGAGLVVSPGNPDLLLRSVQKLRADQERSRTLADSGPRHVERSLTPERSLKAMRNFVVRLMEQDIGQKHDFENVAAS